MEITVDKASKFYEPGEKVTGQIHFKDFKIYDIKGDSLFVKAEAYMDTVSQIRGNMGRPPLEEKDRIYFMKKTVLYEKDQVNTKKFSFQLEATEGDEKLIDAYVGVEFSIVVSISFFCSFCIDLSYSCCLIQYKISVSATSKSSGMRQTGEMQFYVASPGSGLTIKDGRSMIPQEFVISNDNLETSTTQTIPKFKFDGVIATTNCCFSEPFDGYIMKRHSELQIKSVEIQLVRVETFEGKTQATEVQNIQVADGDCIENIEIPTYMLFPKIYSCASCTHKKFKIGFQVNIIVIFHNGYQLTENIPVNVYR